MFGPVASDPTVSRLIARLATDADRALAAIRGARATARARVRGRAGTPRQAGLVTVDLDASLVTAHSDKEWAAKTRKKSIGFHPLLGFVDHGDGGTGEPVVRLLRKGNASHHETDTNQPRRIDRIYVTHDLPAEAVTGFRVIDPADASQCTDRCPVVVEIDEKLPLNADQGPRRSTRTGGGCTGTRRARVRRARQVHRRYLRPPSRAARTRVRPGSTPETNLLGDLPIAARRGMRTGSHSACKVQNFSYVMCFLRS